MNLTKYRLPTYRWSLAFVAVATAAAQSITIPAKCERVITADVAALEQPLYFNRLNALLPLGEIYALKSDVVSTGTSPVNCDAANAGCQAGKVALRAGKRPRPMVLRANVGDCLQINFTNYIESNPATLPAAQTDTRTAGIHITGMELVGSIASDSSYVGTNPNSLSVASPSGTVPATTQYTYYAKEEGNFLLYSFDDGDPGQWASGLFGAVNVQPRDAEWYRSQVTRVDLQNATYKSAHLPTNMTLTPVRNAQGTQVTVRVNGVSQLVSALTTVQQAPAADRHTTTTARVFVCAASGVGGCTPGNIYTLAGQPLVNYSATLNGQPVLSMLDPARVPTRGTTGAAPTGKIVYSDLTAMITGPYAGRFPYDQNSPTFANNPALPDRRQPYREFSIFYHVNNQVVQAFPEYYPGGSTTTATIAPTLGNAPDTFGINYGTGGIGSEILANRLGVGPEKNCVECKFEEFFLSSWALGDPAMVMPDGKEAQYPDDPSNVYHSYLKDHVKFRIFNASPTQQHVHHQHAHQWLHTADDDDSTYLDSQMIIPGAAYTLDMTYDGSGNRNGTIGDSIFHCHFYPHFASGMWSLWRVHDVFEAGTQLDSAGLPKVCGASDTGCWNRALPDGQISAGTPIPALVPLPTLGMAPIPADTKLVDGGTRALVKPAAPAPAPGGSLTYNNPGYPFFIPGIAGHRAPHPPLDFAWEVDATGKPKLDKNGERIPLDGGLPRHLILGGNFVSEFHTTFDFSKDFTVPSGSGPGAGKFVGTMIATELPENGTAVERAAMSSQSQLTEPTYTPDGLPGNFTKNGLPPAPGAPFARPEVDGSGNNVNNVRVYRAAVVQRDVVLNKDGWHYPQQRFLTLWNDVNPTMTGDRPPQPLFFRANTGETVEFWHTNLVPSYYDLDNFQVRTPTDIIGQHIHLVKFDVLASDGAANGFNYEDGTFSPDEVRERISAIDNTGAGKGLYTYNPACWATGGTSLTGCVQANSVPCPAGAVTKPCQKNLKPVTVQAAGYPFGAAPDGQDWTGAQTTIQRWETDPLLDNQGKDRTLRTVFTHDHFGPSTHQQIGLYAGLVVEPDNSQWFESQTNAQMYSRTLDGGPTSWAARIQTADPAESYREFMLEYQDSQFAYTSASPSAKVAPPTALTSFSFGNAASIIANTGTFQSCMASPFPTGWSNGCPTGRPGSSFDTTPYNACNTFRANFCSAGVGLTPQATLSASLTTISDHGGADTYTVSAPNTTATVTSVPTAWYDANPTAIYPEAPSATAVNIISSLDSGITPGTYSVNYRNEPVVNRVTANNPRVQSTGKPGDMSYAFTSITRGDALLNVQPDNGSADGTAPRIYPKCPLSPTQLAGGTDTACKDTAVSAWAALCASNGTCVQPTDPYTPMMRAFEGDNVQIRTLAGAHVRTHPLTLRGLKWMTEPSADNSGYRSTQPTGLSEHFELLFRIPKSGSLSSLTNAADYLFQSSSGLTGTANGSWGILRAYDPAKPVVGLEKLPAPSTPTASAPAPNACPANSPKVSFTVVATNGKNLPNSALVYNTRPVAGNTFNTGNGGGYTFSGGNYNNSGVLYVLTAETNPAEQPELAANVLQQLANGTISPEPLIMRVRAGDCVSVTLQNGLPQQIPGDPGIFSGENPPVNWLAPFLGNTSATSLYPGLKLSTSVAVGMSPQLVSYDITQNAGFNIGFNPDQLTQPMATQPNPGVAPNCTTSPASCKAYTWYAGTMTGQTTGIPIELGSINLLPSDPLLQEPLGLYGALIVEPKDSTWTIDPTARPSNAGSRASATVSRTITELDGVTRTESFRDFVLIAQDDAYVNKTEVASNNVPPPFGAVNGAPPRNGSHGSGATNEARVPAPNSAGTNAGMNLFNYRTETIDARYKNAGTYMDLTSFYSNTQVGGSDPQTPVFTAAAGSHVRFRVLRPGQDDDIVMTIHGHLWQEEPFAHASREIGFNPSSNWFGSQQIGSNDKLDILAGEAGGTMHVPGDYVFNGILQSLNPQNLGGMWGILRVTADTIRIGRADFSPSDGLRLQGSLSKAPDGTRATSVHILQVNGAGGVTNLGEAAVAADGTWSFRSRVNLPNHAVIRVVSNLPSLWRGEVTVAFDSAPELASAAIGSR